MKRFGFVLGLLAFLSSGCALFPGYFFTLGGFNGVVDIASSEDTVFLIDRSGTVYAAGINFTYQLGLAEVNEIMDFRPTFYNALQVACGVNHTLVLDSRGNVWGVGENYSGQLGMPGLGGLVSNWTIVYRGAQFVAARSMQSYIIDTAGRLWVAGDNMNSQLGVSEMYVSNWTQALDNVVEVAPGEGYALAVRGDGTLWGTGESSDGQMGISDFFFTWTNLNRTDVVAIAAGGGGQSFYIDINRDLWATGANNSGELGTGSYFTIYTWTKVQSDIDRVSAGDMHSLALRGGDLLAAGANPEFQLGIGDTGISYPDWTLIRQDIKTFHAAGSFSLIHPWGDINQIEVTGANGSGQLGLGFMGTVSNWTAVNLPRADFR